jgi:O-acetyl-ADP-ribose deacetylase (regulator of RNase III)
VGPIWSGGKQGEDGVLRDCYLNCLALAWEQKLRTLSFPSVSTGVYGYPVERAAGIALGAVIDFIRRRTKARIKSRKLPEVRFVLFSDQDLDAYRRALESID